MGAITNEQALDAIDRNSQRFVQMLASRPESGSRPIPNSTWTVLDVARHALSGLRSYAARADGGPPMWATFESGAADNARLIESTDEHDLATVTAAIPGAVADFVRAYAAHGDADVPWHEDSMVPILTAYGMITGELVLHGRDVALALDVPWPIDRRDALVILDGAMAITPHFVDEDAARGLTATYDIRLRGGPSYTWAFTDGSLIMARGHPDHADCHMSVDPTAFMLIAYGREPLWKAIVTGKAISWGRKPWLGFRAPSLIRNP